ncbi:hypothetical protein P9Y62_21765 [Bacillus thuringiensis]|uniref:Uncharacterized protein n=1 Tax=Bacillus thuringiensis HD-771 TaxID=1218175 RepID=A0A9W3JHA1_BACTU|nr:hypothetical protein [Bacillus thuringiensis]EEM38617.1 hypothetical protein bthur0004_54750 [Bacillus thuringiensis serovar sotto str. T04001]AFQ19936.1 hypothetical protein BTG_33023 [Bacillus thuringiensis HD-771]MEB4894310.1 hypothetical protein [Bacillus thuringiensis]MEC2726612.1 hypothetical protein [Bacillus thuringiensis]MEC2752337.1 hypothetical protein [Bacillus thuringiensis]
MKHIKSTLPIQLFEKKYFNIVIAGRTMATIEVLCFDENKYAAQAKIIETNKEISTAVCNPSCFKTLDDALQEIVSLIDEEIKDNDWVKKTIVNTK